MGHRIAGATEVVVASSVDHGRYAGPLSSFPAMPASIASRSYLAMGSGTGSIVALGPRCAACCCSRHCHFGAVCRVADSARFECGLLRDRDLDGHSQQRVHRPDKASCYRHHLSNIPRDRDGNQIWASDAPIRGIEANPPCARHIDLRPRVGRTRVCGPEVELVRM